MQTSNLSHYPDKPYPVTAIHGSASSGALWKKLASHCLSGRTLFAPDLAGYGLHDQKKLNVHATLEERATPVIQAIERMSRPTHLVAHSFGGSVALEILKKIPHKVKSLTLFEPVAPALLRDSNQPGDPRLLGDMLSLSEIVSGTSGQVGMETFINFWHEPGAWEILPEAAQARLAELAPVVYQDFREAYRIKADSFSSIDYQGPVKILIGNKTNMHAKRMATLIQDYFPAACLQTLPGMGHMGPLTHPEKVNRAILEHIYLVELRECSKGVNLTNLTRKNGSIPLY